MTIPAITAPAVSAQKIGPVGPAADKFSALSQLYSSTEKHHRHTYGHYVRKPQTYHTTAVSSHYIKRNGPDYSRHHYCMNHLVGMLPKAHSHVGKRPRHQRQIHHSRYRHGRKHPRRKPEQQIFHLFRFMPERCRSLHALT